ncbi:MAG: antibiotic biosynthesis monooxygenase [Chitinophagaceae bacterium]|nr:antibiotic biosynthesis monooxygenase [Chitinophagaceae bacterium]
MKPQAIYVFAKWQVKKENLQEVLKLLPEMVNNSKKEDGNLFYNVHKSVADPHTLLLFEGYRNEEALDKHRNSAHFNALVVDQIVPLLENREVVIAHELWPAESPTINSR